MTRRARIASSLLAFVIAVALAAVVIVWLTVLTVQGVLQ